MHALKTGLKLAWLLWAGMILTLPFYLLISHILKHPIILNLPPDFPIVFLRTLFYVVTMVLFLTMNGLRQWMLKPRDIAATLSYPACFGIYIRALLVSLALSESIALFGFVLFLLGDTIRSLYMFSAVATLAMLLYRPKRNELEDLINRHGAETKPGEQNL